MSSLVWRVWTRERFDFADQLPSPHKPSADETPNWRPLCNLETTPISGSPQQASPSPISGWPVPQSTYNTTNYRVIKKYLCTWRLQYKKHTKIQYFEHFQSPTVTVLYWTRSSRTQFGVSIKVWRLAGDTLNINCNFLYCNHQVHRDFLITLYFEKQINWNQTPTKADETWRKSVKEAKKKEEFISMWLTIMFNFQVRHPRCVDRITSIDIMQSSTTINICIAKRCFYIASLNNFFLNYGWNLDWRL